MTIRIECDAAACAELWQRYRPSASIHHDWQLRYAMASQAGIRPMFFVDDEAGTVLPSGIDSQLVRFYGGRFYTELNGFIGPTGGERRIFTHLDSCHPSFRLLSWQSDPAPYLDPNLRRWDVPYQEYWSLPVLRSFDAYLDQFAPTERKDIAYLLRRFVDDSVVHTFDSGIAAEKLIAPFIDHTIQSFQRRGKSCVYEDPTFRSVATILLDCLAKSGCLRVLELRNGGEPCGLVVFADNEAANEIVYYFNLYKPRPSGISNAGLLGLIFHAVKCGRRLDGMRGSFGLKKRYGLKPHPSYAIVRDPLWKIGGSADLDAAEKKQLYGRPFGALPI